MFSLTVVPNETTEVYHCEDGVRHERPGEQVWNVMATNEETGERFLFIHDFLDRRNAAATATRLADTLPDQWYHQNFVQIDPVPGSPSAKAEDEAYDNVVEFD